LQPIGAPSIEEIDDEPVTVVEKPKTRALKPIKVRPANKPEKSSKDCPECGSPGRHRKDCSRAGKGKLKESIKGNKEWQALGEAESSAGKKKRLTEHQYNQIKIAHQHELPPDTIASEMGLTSKMVNTVILSRSYDEYTS
jgi:hypothetical protein